MSATRDGESYEGAQAIAREIRETVADQLHDLIIERGSMGSHTEVVRAVRHVSEVSRRLTEARGRQLQAREMGMSASAAVREEVEARELLRSAVMSVGAACGLWAAAMDFERRRPDAENGAV